MKHTPFFRILLAALVLQLQISSSFAGPFGASSKIGHKSTAKDPVAAYLEIFKTEHQKNKSNIREFLKAISFNKLRVDEMDYLMRLANEDRLKQLPELKVQGTSIIFKLGEKNIDFSMAQANQDKFFINNYQLNFSGKSTLEDKAKYVNAVIRKQIETETAAATVFNAVIGKANAIAFFIPAIIGGLVVVSGTAYALLSSDYPQEIFNAANAQDNLKSSHLDCRKGARFKDTKMKYTAERLVGREINHEMVMLIETSKYEMEYPADTGAKSVVVKRTTAVRKITDDEVTKYKMAGRPDYDTKTDRALKKLNAEESVQNWEGSSPMGETPESFSGETTLKGEDTDYKMFAALHNCCFREKDCAGDYNTKFNAQRSIENGDSAGGESVAE